MTPAIGQTAMAIPMGCPMMPPFNFMAQQPQMMQIPSMGAPPPQMIPQYGPYGGQQPFNFNPFYNFNRFY